MKKCSIAASRLWYQVSPLRGSGIGSFAASGSKYRRFAALVVKRIMGSNLYFILLFFIGFVAENRILL
jgi:hypothetical protein